MLIALETKSNLAASTNNKVFFGNRVQDTDPR